MKLEYYEQIFEIFYDGNVPDYYKYGISLVAYD